MAVTSSQKPDLASLVQLAQKDFPGVHMEAGEAFFWSPQDAKITYRSTESSHQTCWAFVHELAHADLGHASYTSDFELLLLEVAAWERAKGLARRYGLTIDNEHIQDCLDTYRDWLHQRATCPRCTTVSFQASSREYHCHNCLAEWSVSASRFCRPYRQSRPANKKSPEENPQATFGSRP